MPFSINSNVSSLFILNRLNQNRDQIGISLQRLSTGFRINGARDDVAGLSASVRLAAEIGGLNQSLRNANDGISIAQIADGALQESSNLLTRIRSLSLQAANATTSAADRANIQTEVSQLNNELTRIAKTTRFNGRQLLDGNFNVNQFQIGAFKGDTVGLSIPSATSTAIGNFQVKSATGASSLGGVSAAGATKVNNNFAAQTLTVSGLGASSTGAIAVGSSAKAVADEINLLSSTTGVTASAETTATLSGLSASGTVSFTLYGDPSASGVAISAAVTTTDLSGLRDAINQTSVGITASIETNGSLTLTSEQGFDVAIEDFLVDTGGNQTIDLSSNGNTVQLTDNGTADSATAGGVVSFNASDRFSVVTDTGSTLLASSPSLATLTPVSDINVSTQQGAEDALAVLDSAIETISAVRSVVGSLQSRLENAIASNSSTVLNAETARGRIVDADFAKETVELTRAQLLEKTGLSLLAQANVSPRDALLLLQTSILSG